MHCPGLLRVLPRANRELVRVRRRIRDLNGFMFGCYLEKIASSEHPFGTFLNRLLHPEAAPLFVTVLTKITFDKPITLLYAFADLANDS
jgi:hypothetical protein